MTTQVYPLVIKMRNKDVQIGSIKVDISSGSAISRIYQEHDVTIEEINIQFKKGDWVTKVISLWR